MMPETRSVTSVAVLGNRLARSFETVPPVRRESVMTRGPSRSKLPPSIRQGVRAESDSRSGTHQERLVEDKDRIVRDIIEELRDRNPKKTRTIGG
jgi:hypothetical protein